MTVEELIIELQKCDKTKHVHVSAPGVNEVMGVHEDAIYYVWLEG